MWFIDYQQCNVSSLSEIATGSGMISLHGTEFLGVLFSKASEIILNYPSGLGKCQHRRQCTEA